MGKNCVLAYVSGGVTHTFSAYGIGYSHGFELAATESSTRRQRAYYPRRVYPSQFTVTLALKANTTIDANDRPVAGTSEYDRWGAFMAGYFNFMLELGQGAGSTATRFPGMMSVTMIGRGFTRFGIPLGATFGDHLASIFYTPTITFETAVDPYDPATNFLASYFDESNAVENDPAFANSAYPFSDYSTGTHDDSAYTYEQLIDYRISANDVESTVNQITGQNNAAQSFNPYTNTGSATANPQNTIDANTPPVNDTTDVTTYGGT